VDQRPVSFISYNRKTAILHGQIWPTHKSDVVGIKRYSGTFPLVTASFSLGLDDTTAKFTYHPMEW
jgi:hypothetical protein